MKRPFKPPKDRRPRLRDIARTIFRLAARFARNLAGFSIEVAAWAILFIVWKEWINPPLAHAVNVVTAGNENAAFAVGIFLTGAMLIFRKH